MGTLRVVILAVALTASPAAAADDHVDHIDSLVHKTMVGLDAVVRDDAAPPACRVYADVFYLYLHLLEELSRRPYSAATRQTFDLVFQTLITARDRCRTAT